MIDKLTKKKYLLALSSGIDSVYLFHKLIENNIDFQVCHINHHTRGNENTIELSFCKELCEKFDKVLIVRDFKYVNGNFQQQARIFRQNTFIEIVKNNNLDGVLTAHHKDDQVENILMHKNRISSKLMQFETEIEGVNFYKPLLNIYKDDIYTYIENNKLKYMEDSSNSNLKYYRNYIRDYIKKNLNIEDKNKLINDEIKRTSYFLSKCSEISINEIKNKYILHLFLSNNGYEMNHHFITMVFDSLTDIGNKMFYLDNDNALYLNYGVLSIDKIKFESEEKKQTVKGINTFNNIKFMYDNDNHYIRNYVQGDKIRNKKVTKIFIDEKIYKQYRTVWPLIVDKNDTIIKVITKKELV